MPATEPAQIAAAILCQTVNGTITLPEFGAAQITALAVAVLCLFISGFVSGSEMAFFSLTPAQCEELDETPRGASIRRLLADPQRLLATILIANNLVNVTIVVLCNFALGPIFEGMGAVASFVLQTVLLTFLILLFGEIIPKLYANTNNAGWARVAIGGISAIARTLGPMAKLLVKTGAVVKHVVTKESHEISASELSRALELTEATTGDDKEMLEGILKFGDTTADRKSTRLNSSHWS